MTDTDPISAAAGGGGGVASAYPDDGHIFVCVRVRDVPQTPCLHPASTASTNAGSGASRKTTTLKEAQKICVSTLENIVVMHDPKGLDDASSVARDANNVVQLLTDRANAAAAGARPSTRPSTRKSTGTTRTRSSTGAGRKGGANRPLIGTQTANYYECDQCITSMDEASLLKMPMIKNSDFLRPPPTGTQEDVYRATAMHAVSAAVEGINSCVFAYGQTGSGKTYTLFGDTNNIRRDPGIVPRTLDDLFSQLEALKTSHGANAETDYSYAVHLSFFEIYNNEVYCLFSRQGPLHVQFMRDPSGKRETMIISDLQQQTVTSAAKAYPLVEMGLRRRQTGETGMNARSSRSHAILQIRVAQWRTNRETRETVEHNATINLVDLAGSERQKTANTQGKNREEGIQINQSLATLARVINDIASGQKFVNYRDSLLTMALKDDLGGNSKTFMIATVSPIAFSYQESCATLTYAKDVRRIRNRPTVNRTFQTKASLLEQNARLKTENEKLKEQMEEWMRRWNRGGGAADGDPNSTNISAITLSPDGTPGKPLPHLLGDVLETVALSPMQHAHGAIAADGASAGMGSGGHEALLAATGAAGLTAPLVISSHRKYTNIAGIGGSCVEGGVIRVTSLVRERARLRLSDILRQGTPLSKSCPGTAASLAEGETADHESKDDSGDRKAEGREEEDGAKDDFGYLEFERVGQRSCEQRFYVRFVMPTEEAACAAIADVQVNGKSIGTDGRREMHHGDVVCAYLEDVDTKRRGDAATGGGQNLLSFHFVDLNCLSRAAASVNHATLGQLAVSVDLPSEVEGLTLDDIQQLQRDRDKLLDLVQQQKETIEFQCQQQQQQQQQPSKKNRGLSFVSSISPSPEMGRESPEPFLVERSPSCMATPALAQKAALEAFKRTSVSPSMRGRSQLPADVANEELLRRAQEQRQSQARLDGAMDENRQLHRAVATRNATLEALAKRLAELEAGGGDAKPRAQAGSSHSRDERHSSTDHSASRSCASAADGESQSAPLAAGDDDDASSVSFLPSVSRSLTRVSVSSSEEDLDGRSGAAKDEGGRESGRTSSNSSSNNTESRRPAARGDSGGGGGEVISALSILRTQEIELSLTTTTTPAPAFFEGAEGARERYKAAVREAQLNDRIAALEALLAELRGQLALQESRLRVSKDDTLEQEMLREQVEAERDALLRELQALRAENATLNREAEQLETFLKRSEEALAAALAIDEDELMKKAHVMAEQLRALKALALLWKRRAMKYIAMDYAGDAGERRLDHIPWAELQYGATAQVAKAHMGGRGGVSDEAALAIDEFEKATAVESVRALEAALRDLERENCRLQDQIRQYEDSLQQLQDLISRLKAERDSLEREMRDNAAMDEEERQRLQRMLDHTNKDLAEAESNSRAVQKQLEDTVEQSNTNAKKTNQKHDQLLSEQRQKLMEMENKMDEIQDSVVAKDEELRTLLCYMEDNDMVGIDGAVRDMELRGRIEDLIQDAMKDYDTPTGYSAFPADFRFSQEMVALIRICLRILLDRLKIELYVLNKQTLHKFGMLVPTVQLRPEAQFQVFMHELRGVASEVAGRSQRIGGKWTATEADVLANLLDHRRRRAGGALYGLLIWYDHWDLSPKAEHVCYMELIRNSDRIMQMARQVRQESILNTNATSTLLMPVPSGAGRSESAFVPDSSRRKDKSVSESCRILNRFSESTRRSNLAAALNEAGTPSKGGGGAAEDKENNRPFSRSATALALSQNMPFSRTSSALPSASAAASAGSRVSPGVLPAKPPRPAPPLPSGASPAAAPSLLPSPPLSATPEATCSLAVSPQKLLPPQNPHAAYRRVASAGVLPVTDNDVAFVAGSDVEQASSLNRFNYERRMSLNSGLNAPPPPPAPPRPTGEDSLNGTCKSVGKSATSRASGKAKPESSSRKASSRFSRSHTAMPTMETVAGRKCGGMRRPSLPVGPAATSAARKPPASSTNATAPHHPPSTVAFGRSQSAAVVMKPTAGLPRGSELSKPNKRSSTGAGAPVTAHPFKLSRQSTAAAAPLAREDASAMYSPKPRTPLGVASKTKKAGAAHEERFAAPTSFCNPSIMEALRQRSASESNGPSTRSKTGKAGATASALAKKFKATPSTRHALGGGSGAAAKPSGKSTPATHKKSTAAAGAATPSAAAVTRTATRPRRSATEKSEDAREQTTPVVPPLSFAQLLR